ncbi:MAG: hypothetical protein HFI33_12935 [Lachnospiraceae bacterium]|nr:hypothetical protein [Lachnospiraceae bacterium]
MKQETMSRAEKEMIMMWKQPLTISDNSEEKIQAAYDQVLRQCRQKTKDRKVRHFPSHTLRRLAVASMAAVVLVGSGVGVAAAMGYFTKTVEQENEEITYKFQVNYELQPVEVTVEPEYLPQGLAAGDDGKYYDSQKEGRAISIMPINMLNLDTREAQMNFGYVDQVEHMTIQDMEADVITSKDAQKYQRGSQILMFNSSQGYVIWLWGDYDLPVEELKKVAEQLKITTEENSALAYDSEKALADKEAMEAKEASGGYDEEYAQFIANGIKADTLVALGEERDCPYSGAKFRIEEVQVYDSIYEVPDYTEEGLYDREELIPWIEEDGTHKPYERACYDSESGQVLGEETANAKFMAVKIHVSHYGEESEDVALDAQLVLMEKPGADGAYHLPGTYYDAVPSENYDLQMDNSCFYLSTPQNLEGENRLHSFFYRTMEPGEEMTYTIIFAVDQDVLADESMELLLKYNAAAGDIYEADCRLEK